MRLLVTHEIHAMEVGGRFYNPNGVIDYNALCNYRQAIKEVVVIVRCKKANSVRQGWLRIDGEGISIWPIPEPASVLHAFVLLPVLTMRILRAANHCDRCQIRLPGPTGMAVATVFCILRRKYAVECVGHALEGYIHIRSKLRLKAVYGFFLHIINKFLVKHAFCVAYRSQYLRKLYPNKCSAHEWVFSGAQIDEEVIGSPRQVEFFTQTPFNIMYVGRLEAEKGLMSLLSAFKKVCDSCEKPLRLHIIGDGTQWAALKSKAEELNIREHVYFHGRLSRGPELFPLMDRAHLFVLPSLTEGMPRSLIEAMARGLPALCSSAGGIPELLDDEFLFQPNDESAIADKIRSVVDNPKRLADMSSRNFEASKEHWSGALRVAKDGFWKDVELCST